MFKYNKKKRIVIMLIHNRNSLATGRVTANILNTKYHVTITTLKKKLKSPTFPVSRKVNGFVENVDVSKLIYEHFRL